MDHVERRPQVKHPFPWEMLKESDFELAEQCLRNIIHQPGRPLDGAGMPYPDLVIAPEGQPYIYRWHTIPHSDLVNQYFHIQTLSDPERPLHDHPWDNTSVILSGGYDETVATAYNIANSDGYDELCLLRQGTVPRRAGNTIFRRAADAHRLLLPKGIPYTMTLFFTGPKIKEWGFWVSDTKWVPAAEFIEDRNGMSVQKKPGSL